jgi:hypothetical protein
MVAANSAASGRLWGGIGTPTGRHRTARHLAGVSHGCQPFDRVTVSRWTVTRGCRRFAELALDERVAVV